MRDRHLLCPVCGTVLAVPPGYSNCFVRCGQCHHRFRLPRRIAATEDAIANWLTEGRERDEDDLATVENRAAPTDESVSGGTAILPSVGHSLRLVEIGRQRVLFEFPASRLLESAFRCAMPRRCLRCGARAHLHVHVIIYTPRLADSISLEAEHSAGELKLNEAEASKLSPEELLQHLPRVPNVPHPGDLPMPYWLCDMCTGAGMISGQINMNSATGEGFCRLLFRNLRRAEEFLINAGERDSPSHTELRRNITATAENPWDTLPLVVQHRLQQWFQPGAGERFVAYIPDRDRARTEDGMAGIAVSNRRLIYHRQMRHREVGITEVIELQMATETGKDILRIKTSKWQAKHITLDRVGIDRLRRALTAAKFRAFWR